MGSGNCGQKFMRLHLAVVNKGGTNSLLLLPMVETLAAYPLS